MLNRILEIILGTLFVGILLVTAVVVSADKKAEQESKKLENLSQGKENAVDAFTDLGQLRIQTKNTGNDENCVVVVVPWFSYPQGDTALYEELCKKERELSSIIVKHISSFTADELRNNGEMKLKEQIMELVNSQLVLGQIRGVYFNEYLFLD